MCHPVRFVVLAALLCLGAPGGAAAHPDQPLVGQRMFAAYDIEALRAGEWVEYEEVVAEEPLRTKFACVAVEEDVAWIEYTGPILSFFWPETMLRFAVSRKDRLIVKALWGEPGQAGREITVTREEGADNAALKRTGAGVVSGEALKVKDRELKCEKVALDYASGETRFISRVWTCAEVPFRYAPSMAHLTELRWEGKPAFPGGLVRRETQNPSNGKTVEFVLIGWGTDAEGKLQAR